MLPNQAQPKPGVRKALGVKGSVPKGGLKRRLSIFVARCCESATNYKVLPMTDPWCWYIMLTLGIIGGTLMGSMLPYNIAAPWILWVLWLDIHLELDTAWDAEEFLGDLEMMPDTAWVCFLLYPAKTDLWYWDMFLKWKCVTCFSVALGLWL
jgi:hypothetical protein